MFRNRTLGVLVALTLAVVPATAQAEERTLRDIYKPLYKKVEKKHGNGSAGRNIVADGVKGKKGDRPAKDAEIAESIRTLKNMLAPPPAPAPAPAAAPVVTNSTEAQISSGGGGGGGSGLAAIRQCESGGNYSTDTGNGYYGAYQFDQGTWESVGGSGNPANASPAEQDKRAAMLQSQRGNAPWPVCGQ